MPFVLLLSRAVKREPQLLVKVAVGDAGGAAGRSVLADRAGVPSATASSVSWLDVVLPLTLGSIWLGCFVWQLRGRAILPVHDPQFDEALGRIIERGGDRRGRRTEHGRPHASHATRTDARPRAPRSITRTSDVNIRAIFGFGARAARRRRRRSTCVVWLLFGYLRRAARRRATRRQYPLAAGAGRPRCRRSRGCRPTRARTCAICARARTTMLNSYGWVDKNAGIVRIPIDEAMKLTLQRGLPSRPETRTTHRSDTGQRRFSRTLAGRAQALVSLCLCVLCGLCASQPSARADDRRADAPATSASRACPSSALPAPLREIGFDQNLDQRVPLDTAVQRRDGPRPCGSATTSASGRWCWCSCTTTARCCARRCINGLASALGVLSLEPGKDFEIVTVSFDPRDTPATGRGEESRRTSQRYKRPGAAAGWHFLTGDAAVDRAADEGRRLPLRLGRRRRSSSRTRPASSC